MAVLVDKYLNNPNKNLAFGNFYKKSPIEQAEILKKMEMEGIKFNPSEYNQQEESLLSPSNDVLKSIMETLNLGTNTELTTTPEINKGELITTTNRPAQISPFSQINTSSQNIQIDNTKTLGQDGITNPNYIYEVPIQNDGSLTKDNTTLNTNPKLDVEVNSYFNPNDTNSTLNKGIEKERPNVFQSIIDNYNNYGNTGQTRKLYDLGYNLRNLSMASNNKNLTEEERSTVKKRSTLGAITSGLGFGLEGAKELFSGIGDANMNDFAMTEYNKDIRKAMVKPTGDIRQVMRDNNMRYANFFEEGGEMKFNKDAIAVANDRALMDEGMGNANIEKGEYVDNGGVIKEAVGAKHSEGGINVNLENGDRVLTDSDELGKEKSKSLEKMFKIRLKSKDTYSSVMDKMNKKIGYDEIVEKQEKLIEKLAKNETIEDDKTREINNKLIGIRIDELQKRRDEVETTQKFIYDTLYSIQELEKKKNSKGNIPKVKVPEKSDEFEEVKSGANPKFEDGGEMQNATNPPAQEQPMPELNEQQITDILSQYIKSLPPNEQQTFIQDFEQSSEEEKMQFIQQLLKTIS